MTIRLPPELSVPPYKNNNDNKNIEIYIKKQIFTFTEVYIQSKNNKILNFHFVSIAKEIVYLKLSVMINNNEKGKNRIGIIFKSFQPANFFVNNKPIMFRVKV